MTTTRTPFVPFRAASLTPFWGAPLHGLVRSIGWSFGWGALALAMGSASLAAPPLASSGPAVTQEGSSAGARPSSRIVQLPKETLAGTVGPREILDGHHLRWERDDPEPSILTLGPAVPSRTLISVIEQRIDRDGGRDAGISVENLGSVLLVRGGPSTGAEDLDRAAATANDAVAEFEGLVDALSFRARVSLVGSGEGVEPVELIQEQRTLMAGARTAFGKRTTRSFVADFDVEVATGQAIADPYLAVAETGETLHLWSSTTVDDRGVRQLYVQGLLDIAIETVNQGFDPNVYELGVLEQPTITTFQVMFAGTVPEGAPLVVTLEGLGQGLSQRRLEVWAEPMPAEQGTTDTQRIVDLSRGMWRGSLNLSHALTDAGISANVPESRMPASAAQLMGLMFNRERLPRPDLGSSALFLVGDGVEGASTSFPTVHALFRSIDPTGPTQTVQVTSADGGLKVSLPASLGALIRVARTEETVFVLDYNPQIANEATLADPDSEIFLSGEVMEGVMELEGGLPQLRGSASRRALSEVRIREADPVDIGRIQQPVTVQSAAEFLVPSGGDASPAGFRIQLEGPPK